MVSLEGPPGVFAPVVELCGGRIGDSSCPQSVLLCQFFLIQLDLTYSCETGLYILYFLDNNHTNTNTVL